MENYDQDHLNGIDIRSLKKNSKKCVHLTISKTFYKRKFCSIAKSCCSQSKLNKQQYITTKSRIQSIWKDRAQIFFIFTNSKAHETQSINLEGLISSINGKGFQIWGSLQSQFPNDHRSQAASLCHKEAPAAKFEVKFNSIYYWI